MSAWLKTQYVGAVTRALGGWRQAKVGTLVGNNTSKLTCIDNVITYRLRFC